MRLTIIALIIITNAIETFAQSPDTIDSLKVAFEKQADQSREAFEADAAEAFLQYERYSRQALLEFEKYESTIGSLWGEDNVLLDSKTEWVEYSDDFRDRSVVDFDKGTVTVEILLSSNETVSDTAAVNRRLEEAVTRLLTSKGKTCPYASTVDVSEPLSDRPILEGLIDMSLYESESAETSTVSEKSKSTAPPAPVVKSRKLSAEKKAAPVPEKPYYRKFAERIKKEKEQKKQKENIDKVSAQPAIDEVSIAEAIVESSTKDISRINGISDKGTCSVKISFALATDNMSSNAARYTDLVKEFSEKFNIEPALIFAVMEQESRFNPEAASWVPAYGLMQLVPESGGYDAYRYVYGREWIPTKSYLLNPRNNIELGTAYLRILSNQFKKVENPDCRRLCIIAGYNTGAGNVSRAFTGNTNLSKAFKSINSFDYDGLYNHLRTELNSEEARNYVSGVTGRMNKYIR